MSILSGRLKVGSASTRFFGSDQLSVLINCDGCGEMMRGSTNASSGVEKPLMRECNATLIRCCVLVLVAPIPLMFTDDGCIGIPRRFTRRSVTKLTCDPESSNARHSTSVCSPFTFTTAVLSRTYEFDDCLLAAASDVAAESFGEQLLEGVVSGVSFADVATDDIPLKLFLLFFTFDGA